MQLKKTFRYGKRMYKKGFTSTNFIVKLKWTLLVVVVEIVVAVFDDERLQVSADRFVALLQAERRQDAGGALSSSVAADGAVADAPVL